MAFVFGIANDDVALALIRSEERKAVYEALRKNAIPIEFYVTEAQAIVLEKFFSPRPVCFKPCRHSPHPILAALSDYAEGFCSRSKVSDHIDVGARLEGFLNRFTGSNHACLLLSEGRDEARYKRTLHLRSMHKLRTGRNAVLSHGVEQAVEAIQTGRSNQVVCLDGAENCDFQSTYAVSVHSAYDIKFEFWEQIFSKHGLERATIWLHAPIEMIYTTELRSPDADYCFETVLKNKKKYIRFWFPGDESLAYEHERENWLKYLLQPVLRGKNFNILFEIAERIGPMIRIEAVRVYNAVSVSHCTELRDHSIVKLPNVDEYFCCGPKSKKKPILCPADKVTKGRAWMFNAANSDLCWEKFISYMRSLRSQVFIGSKRIASHWDITDSGFIGACKSIYVLGLCDKYKRGHVLQLAQSRLSREQRATKSLLSRFNLWLRDTVPNALKHLVHLGNTATHTCMGEEMQWFRHDWILDWDYENLQRITTVAEVAGHDYRTFKIHKHDEPKPYRKQPSTDSDLDTDRSSLTDGEIDFDDSASQINATPKSVHSAKIPPRRTQLFDKPSTIGTESTLGVRGLFDAKSSTLGLQELYHEQSVLECSEELIPEPQPGPSRGYVEVNPAVETSDQVKDQAGTLAEYIESDSAIYTPYRQRSTHTKDEDCIWYDVCVEIWGREREKAHHPQFKHRKHVCKCTYRGYPVKEAAKHQLTYPEYWNPKDRTPPPSEVISKCSAKMSITSLASRAFVPEPDRCGFYERAVAIWKLEPDEAHPVYEHTDKKVCKCTYRGRPVKETYAPLPKKPPPPPPHIPTVAEQNIVDRKLEHLDPVRQWIASNALDVSHYKLLRGGKRTYEHKEATECYNEFRKELSRNVKTMEAEGDKNKKLLLRALSNALRVLPLTVPAKLEDPLARAIRIVGPPGTGKSRSVRMTATPNDYVITGTSDLTHEYIEERERAPDSQLFGVNTIHKAIYELSGRKFEKIYIDECYLQNPGLVVALAAVCKWDQLYLVGDGSQIGFIDRNRSYKTDTSMRRYLRHTPGIYMRACYRCPQDVVEILNNAYGYDLISMSKVKKSITFAPVERDYTKDTEKICALPGKLMTFNQGIKEYYSKMLGCPSTVHEMQGKTEQHINLVATADARSLFHNSPAHVIVAISRHTERLVVYDYTGFLRVQLAREHPVTTIARDYYDLATDHVHRDDPEVEIGEVTQHRPTHPPTM